MKNVTLLLLLLQVVSTPVNAFQFDTWTSGMSSREAMAIARDKDIPLVKEGLVSTSKRFNADASVKYVDSADNFYYRTSLLGKNAKINLIFTPESKFLHTLRIQWAGSTKKDGFGQFVFETLTSKYGNHSSKEKDMFFETFFWRIDETNQVSMKTRANVLSVEYLDFTAHAVAQKEFNTKREQRQRDSKKKDAGKF